MPYGPLTSGPVSGGARGDAVGPESSCVVGDRQAGEHLLFFLGCNCSLGGTASAISALHLQLLSSSCKHLKVHCLDVL